MSQLTYNSIRIYKQNKTIFSLKELESLKSFVFNSPFYFTQQYRFVSRFTPLIFSLADNDSCIEAQFNTYDDLVVKENIERLYEMTFPHYEFWFIEANDESCTDKIGRFRALSIGENNYASTSRDNWRNCFYSFDKIELTGTLEIPESLRHIDFQKEENSLLSTDYSGSYTSYSEKNYTDGQRYKLIPEEHTINLYQKYDIKANGISPVQVGSDYYSDERLLSFIRKELASSDIKEIRFYHNSRLTRIISADKPASVTAFDGWDNCADEEFHSLMHEKKLESITDHVLLKS